MARVTVVLPNGRRVEKDVAQGMSMKAMLSEIGELANLDYVVRLEGQDVNEGQDAIERAVLHNVQVRDGDVVSVAPRLVAG